MHRKQLFVASIVITFGLLALLAVGNAVLAATNKNHHDGKQLVADKAKTDGRHVIDKKGKYTTAVETKGGKIAGVHVRHETKGEIPVKKYKTNKKMTAQLDPHVVYASLRSTQSQDLGTVYIGYSYVDDNGNEEIYWFPYDMVLDGDTGAVEYVPES